MRVLLKNARVVNVFVDEVDQRDILIENGKIIGVGDYANYRADYIEDLAGAYVCPRFIDGHMHVESTMLTPAELAKAIVPHGTTAIMTDPHEIANVCGLAGVDYMLQASEGLPLDLFVMMPSCVPASCFDESGAVLKSADLVPYYTHPRVLGLAEMMNFPGIIAKDPDSHQKVHDALTSGMVADGHAPGVRGKNLDAYLAAGIQSDHECTSFEEAREKLSGGMWIMMREGSAARNLEALRPLFNEPYNRRSLLVTDDIAPAELAAEGHLDRIIRRAMAGGVDPLVAIRMVTIQTAQAFKLPYRGAVAPGYVADLLVLDSLAQMKVRDVYKNGVRVVAGGSLVDFENPQVNPELLACVRGSIHLPEISADAFKVHSAGKQMCHVIGIIPGEIVTEDRVIEIDFDKNNGYDRERDIAKVAVIERHGGSGNIGLAFVQGMGLTKGALASSVAHDSHNIVVLGADEESMVLAVQHVAAMGGGCAIAYDGQIHAELPLPVAGLMSDKPIGQVAEADEDLHEIARGLGTIAGVEPFMNMMFLCLPVIPKVKLTTRGLVDVDVWRIVPMIVRTKHKVKGKASAVSRHAGRQKMLDSQRKLRNIRRR